MTIRHLSWIGCALVALGGPACSSSTSDTTGHKNGAIGGHDSGAGGSSGFVVAGDTSPCGASTIATGTFDLTFAGVAYKGNIVHVPASYDGTKRTPLVVNWHGLTSNAPEEEGFSNMDKEADLDGFIVVYPNSPDMSWNAGTCCAFSATTRDDVGFAKALVAQIESEACIDTKRVYSTGMSNGAFMSYRLGCEAADIFAAIAPVAGKVGIPTCNPPHAVPVMAFHGTADPLVAYNAGTLSGETPAATVPQTVQNWATRDSCTGTPSQTFQHGTVTCQTWSECANGATVTLCTATGEGHCWPGTTFCPYGAATSDIDASRQIATFFENYTLGGVAAHSTVDRDGAAF